MSTLHAECHFWIAPRHELRVSVWMRDLLGMSDDLERLGQRVWIRRLEAPVGEFRLGLQAPLYDLLGGSPLQHALASPIVGLVEAFEQRLEIPMAIDRDAEHLALHPPVEALHKTVCLRRVGFGLAMLHLHLAGVRRVLIEGAWTYRFPARMSRLLQERQEKLPQIVRVIAWKAQVRLCARYRRLMAAGKRQTVVTTAIAREMAAFLWAIGREIEPRSAA